MDHAQDILLCRRDLAIDLVDGFGVIADRAGGRQRLGLVGHGNFGAVVAHAKHGKFQRMFFDKVSPFEHDCLTGSRWLVFPPAILKGGARRTYGGVHVRCRSAGNCRQDGTVNRRDDVHRLAGRSRSRLAINEMVTGGHIPIAQFINTRLVHAILPAVVN